MNTLHLIQDGLTFQEVVRQIPLDPAALFAYALLGGFVFMIWRGSRKKRTRS